MNIYFFRHGQTEFNLEDRFQGLSDSNLTTKGVEQAIKIGELLDEIDRAKVFVSPAKRVLDTVEIALYHKFDTITDDRLLEVCYGDWETKKRDEIQQNQLIERGKNRYSFIHPGEYMGHKGESYEDIYERVKSFIEEIKGFDDENIFVFTHNGVLLNAFKYLSNKTNEEINNLRIANDEYVFYDGDIVNISSF